MDVSNLITSQQPISKVEERKPQPERKREHKDQKPN